MSFLGDGLVDINFNYFNEVARKGIPKMNPHSHEYVEWHMEQKRRCMEGYTVGGKYMPGYMYGYINFGTIELYDEKKGRKTEGRPLLRDVEWDVFKYIDQAQKQKKGFMWITGRRGGKSFIGSWCVASEYSFYEDNECVVSGFMHDYSDPHMEKVLKHLDGFHHTNPEFYQKRLTTRIDEELRAGYQLRTVDERGQTKWETKGSNSRIHNIVFKNSHTAANGKSTKLFVFEEIGMFDNLEKSYNSAEACWKEGSHWFGTPILIGTGGDMDRGSISAQKMFYDPDTYNLLTFKDDEQIKGQAYFIPAQYVLNDFKEIIPVEKGGDGITLMTKYDEATAALEATRDRKRKAKDPNAIIQEIQYYPFNAGEAFMQSIGNKFPQDLIQNQINKLITSKAENIGQIGILEYDDDKNLVWKPSADKYEADFPTNKENMEGCIVIYEHPEFNAPNMLYVATTDPYNFDDSATSESIGATIIWKRFQSPTKTYDWPVATYFGRPKTSGEYYNNVIKLLEYFNAMNLHENNVVGMKQHFDHAKALKWLTAQPQIINSIINDSKVDRQYGIHMVDKIRVYGEMKAAEWLTTEYAPGHYNVEKIKSLTLLKELLAYHPNGNFDRVDAFLLMMIYLQDIYNVQVEETRGNGQMPENGLFTDFEKKLSNGYSRRVHDEMMPNSLNLGSKSKGGWFDLNK